MTGQGKLVPSFCLYIVLENTLDLGGIFMFEQYVWPLIHEVLYVVIIAVVPVLAKYIVDLLNSKREEISARAESFAFQDAILRAIQLVQDAVDTTSQTYVEALKKEGKFDSESQKKAMDMTIQSVEKLMDKDMKDLINTVYLDFDEWVRVQIESYIKNK